MNYSQKLKHFKELCGVDFVLNQKTAHIALELCKAKLIEARKCGDIALAAALSQAKEHFKRTGRQIAHCEICGVAISQRASRCFLHKNRLARLVGALIAAFLLSVPSFADSTASISLGWNYDFVSNPHVSTFVIHYGLGTLSTNWDGVTNACRCYYFTGPNGNIQSAIIGGLMKGRTYFFAITAIDESGEVSAYSPEFAATMPCDDCNTGNAPSNVVVTIQ